MKNINWEKIGADAILLSNPKNIRHFTGLKASLGYVLISKKETILFADSRYIEDANNIFKGKVVLYKGIDSIKEFAGKFDSIAIESDYVTIDFSNFIKKINPNIVNINGQELRMVKSEEDIINLQKAVDITKEVMEWASKKLLPGVTEKEISRMVIFKLDEMGSEELDYQPIISSGPNSSLPHAHPSNRKLKEGDTVMFDFAAVINGFTADITRNYSVGKLINEEIIKIKKIVRKSQLAGIQAIKPGVTGAEIDKICRDIIVDEGYGEFFGHGTGHGLGRDVHELPNVSPNSQIKFEEGHVVTVEPGIYLPGVGGIRIEDDILITKDGFKIL